MDLGRIGQDGTRSGVDILYDGDCGRDGGSQQLERLLDDEVDGKRLHLHLDLPAEGKDLMHQVPGAFTGLEHLDDHLARLVPG